MHGRPTPLAAPRRPAHALTRTTGLASEARFLADASRGAAAPLTDRCADETPTMRRAR
ncbi:hypothetical protein BURMUCF1_0167 [Burkholderia multivorans ATCC BAA-247]|uniref:Uncharacterized protein n=1 Tax=Burkholderia multivorans CGD2 TaxID=513052 RepID=B9BV41_9BURK|nr:hypothetical protein BURMUCGD2_0375 [Burkholderia multivorans CGD2]EEE10929.1 hypothetical protein BURMUCGD2M_0371 [Burkholderia multivorans CGD2M]EJO52790.1 hypothetical protein BURMUCF1_0167 [Burkholderia multivorans ATCC BAA-247]